MKTCPACQQTYPDDAESCPRDGSRLAAGFRDERECPYCAELILKKARVCKHCGRDVEPLAGTGIAAQAPSPAPPERITEPPTAQAQGSEAAAAASGLTGPAKPPWLRTAPAPPGKMKFVETMKCPNCRLENPPAALRCDCGYDFLTRTSKQYHLTGRDAGGMRKLWRGVRSGLFALCGFAAAYSAYGTLKALLIGGSHIPVVLFLPALWNGDPYDNTLYIEAHALNTVLFGVIVLLVLVVRKNTTSKGRISEAHFVSNEAASKRVGCDGQALESELGERGLGKTSMAENKKAEVSRPHETPKYMPGPRKYRGLWILAWFIALFIFNLASHWAQYADRSGLYIFVEALQQLTTPAKLLVSAFVVYGILSYGGTGAEPQALKKRLYHTIYILVAVVAAVLVIGLVIVVLSRGGTKQVEKADVKPNALDNYELMSKSKAEIGSEEDGLSPETKKGMREMLALELAGGFQKQNNPMRVDVVGDNHDVLVFQLPSMNEELANEAIQGLQQGDANFWNGMRLMNYSQVVFAGDAYKRVVSREEFVRYGNDYEKYKAAFLKAADGFVAGAHGEVEKPSSQPDTSTQPSPAPSATLPTLAHLKALMKEDIPGMSPREFKRMRAATGIGHIMELLHKDSFKPVSALYLADGTVCYRYSFVADGKQTEEYGVLTTDGQLYVNAFGTAPWNQLCKGEKGEETVEAVR
jgi:hypothetical protein